MTKKTRLYRKLQRAKNTYWQALEDNEGVYTKKLFFAQLNMMYVNRQYRNLVPKPLPKISYIYESTKNR